MNLQFRLMCSLFINAMLKDVGVPVNILELSYRRLEWALLLQLTDVHTPSKEDDDAEG